MKIAGSLVITVFILFIAMGTFVVFAQEAAVLSPNDLAPASTLESPEDTEGNTQWVWGEVTNLDIKANIVTLKYLDYENDQEKEFALVVDGNTVYENLKSFDEIKIKDTLSIDYKVALDGKNFAKNISLEKSDIIPVDAQDSAVGNMPLSVPLQTAAPVMEQPIVESAVTAAPEVAPVAAQQAQ